MTEAQWLKSRDPGKMLDHLQPDEGSRKVRLFKCACCYLMWPLLVDERSREGVLVAERYADGAATSAELRRAITAVEEATRLIERKRRGRREPEELFLARKGAAKLALDTTSNAGFWAAGVARWIRHPAEGGAKPDSTFPPSPLPTLPTPAPGKNRDQLYRWLARLVRDVFGNPFHPVAFSPQWRTDTTLSVARQMYDSRDFCAMPILADALEDAGCDNTDILDHLRGPGPHVRGCWPVDLLLARG
jgi:hypothetical protein